jgi:hypothetical protein
MKKLVLAIAAVASLITVADARVTTPSTVVNQVPMGNICRNGMYYAVMPYAYPVGTPCSWNGVTGWVSNW